MAVASSIDTRAAEVFREHSSELYRILIDSETSRRLVAIELYSKNVLSQREYDKVKETEILHGADRSTDEILKKIVSCLTVEPAKADTLLKLLGKEVLLKPVVALMEAKLLHAPMQSLAPKSVVTVSSASLTPVSTVSSQSSVSMEPSLATCHTQSSLQRQDVYSTDGQQGIKSKMYMV